MLNVQRIESKTLKENVLGLLKGYKRKQLDELDELSKEYFVEYQKKILKTE